MSNSPVPYSVALYARELSKSKYNPISHVRELELLDAHKKNKDQIAFDALVCSNLRYVVNIAGRFSEATGCDYLDLIQEGNIGLMKAIERFDSKPGYRLLSYAHWWIQQQVMQAIALKTKSAQTITNLLDLAEKGTDIDTSFGVNGHLEDGFIRTVARKEFVDDILTTFYKILSLREYVIMKLHYGLDPIIGRPLKLRELGEIFRIDAERVRQVINQALTKLKEADREWGKVL